jgi:hypothetical protein
MVENGNSTLWQKCRRMMPSTLWLPMKHTSVIFVPCAIGITTTNPMAWQNNRFCPGNGYETLDVICIG